MRPEWKSSSKQDTHISVSIGFVWNEMTDREQIERAIEPQESLCPKLGDKVVDLTIPGMRRAEATIRPTRIRLRGQPKLSNTE